MAPRILYLTPGVFEKGGIQRYNRYQIQALRTLAGAGEVIVHSVHGPGGDDFEEPFEVDWIGGGTGRVAKLRYAARTLSAAARRPALVWAAHINLLPLAMATAAAARASSVVNVYGLEVWSNRRPLVELAMRRAPHVVSDCHNTADYLRREKAWRGRTLDVAWDCVDVRRFAPGAADGAVLARLGVDPHDRRLVVLMFGRMARAAAHKGWERLPAVIDAVNDPRFLFVLAGDGDLRPVLAAECARRGLQARVHFTGRVHEDDLVHLYRRADVFTLVSDAGHGRGEGIPLTPLEAAACATPIVVGNQDGSREAVDEGVNGFIVDPFDIGAHAERIRRLGDDHLRAQMGQAARERILRHHSFEGFVEAHRQVLAHLAVD
jgi:phosphatidylinositol alpha-1,6-mannosyltransferase